MKVVKVTHNTSIQDTTYLIRVGFIQCLLVCEQFLIRLAKSSAVFENGWFYSVLNIAKLILRGEIIYNRLRGEIVCR